MNAFDFPPVHGPKPVHHPVHHEPWGPKPPVPPCAPGPTPNPYSLIHPFNKVCFKNYKEAVTMLKHKNLIPGEFAFAYYYDKTADFGVNAISAVGSIKVGAANIIFDNSEFTTSAINELKLTVLANNEKVESVQNIIEQLKEKFDIIDDAIDSIEKTEQVIDDISTKIAEQNSVNASIIDRLDTVDEQISYINAYIEDHNDDYNALCAKVAELVADSSTKDDDIDSINQLILNLNNKIDSSISELEIKLTNLISTSDADLKAELIKQFNSDLAEYAGGLTALKTEIETELDEKITAVNGDIYDINTKINSLESKITSAKNEAIAESKSYADELIASINENTAIENVKLAQKFHDINDAIENVSDNLRDELKAIKRDIAEFKDETTEEVNKNNASYDQELERQKQFLSDSIDQFKQTYTAETRAAVDQKVSAVTGKLNELSNIVATNKGEVETSLATLRSEFNTYKANLTGDIDTKVAELRTQVQNHASTLISREHTYNEDMYAKKTDIPMQLIAANGLSINQGVISLNIDANGILTIGSNRYQLQKLN